MAGRLRGSLEDRGIRVFHLDGDSVRDGLCKDLGFSSADRIENHRRIAEVARLVAIEGSTSVVVATMAPEHAQRDIVRGILHRHLVWIHVHAPLEVCIRRDPKGLYRKAREGKVARLLDFPFETLRPDEREIWVDTVAMNIEDAHRYVFDEVFRRLGDYEI